ncbi:MAG TPA: DUF3738 domain-containing protein [Bryobacteraceae bacterium]|nr:DUF3738 domain-containing protein [Bryobacteraceae bacterium]
MQSVSEQPSPNPPGTAAALPKRPLPQFDVASARPCDGTGGTTPARYDATGRVTANCEDALKKQLGLKLKISKRPQPVLVIDHMEEKPAEN